MQSPAFLSDLLDYSHSCMPEYTKQLLEMVSIPSVSAGTEHQADLQKMAEYARDLLAKYGFTAKVVPTKGSPAIVGLMEVDPKAPWITVYNHMDVQPAKEPQWKTSPFEPLLKEGIVIGRGSTDDKGPALSIVHAIHYLKSRNIPMPNIQVIYETEEEIGSPNFGAFLDDNKGWLKDPESILISDTIFEGEHPAITYKLKGMQRVELELVSGSKDLHSGIFGGAVENPLSILISVLAKMVNEKGEILIPEIAGGDSSLNPEEEKALSEVASIFDLKKFNQDSGEASRYSENVLEILTRIWHKPTLEIHGFSGAQHEVGVLKSAISPSVRAKVSLRLIPGQEPKAIVSAIQSFVKSIHPGIEVHDLGGQKASFTPLSDPFLKEASVACTVGFGRPPLFTGCGGTIGAIPQFQRVWPQRAVVLIAQSLMSDGYHAPNEQFELIQGQRGIVALATYLNRVSRMFRA